MGSVGGVVELSSAGVSVLFSHDLIQQHVYENVPIKEQRQLHLDIGTYILSQILLDSLLRITDAATKSAGAGVQDLNLGKSSAVNVDDAHKGELSPTKTTSLLLVAIATNQINFAGPDSVLNRTKQIRFAG